MKNLEQFLDLMECFPSAFAQPNNGWMPEDILRVAAEIRDKANMPRPETPPEPGMGAFPPPPMRYTGNCNGCGAPVFIPESMIKD